MTWARAFAIVGVAWAWAVIIWAMLKSEDKR